MVFLLSQEQSDNPCKAIGPPPKSSMVSPWKRSFDKRSHGSVEPSRSLHDPTWPSAALALVVQSFGVYGSPDPQFLSSCSTEVCSNVDPWSKDSGQRFR